MHLSHTAAPTTKNSLYIIVVNKSLLVIVLDALIKHGRGCFVHDPQWTTCDKLDKICEKHFCPQIFTIPETENLEVLVHSVIYVCSIFNGKFIFVIKVIVKEQVFKCDFNK